MNQEEFVTITSPYAQCLLQEHINSDPYRASLFLQKKFSGHTLIAEQILCHTKAVKKLPHLSKERLVYESQALEQCSSEVSAEYKSTLIKGKRLFDGTGGLGIDTIFLSKNFTQTTYCDQDSVLCKLFQYNCNQIGITDILVVNKKCEDALLEYPDKWFDWIFLDPSRRYGNRRYGDMKLYQPSIYAIMPLLQAKTREMCIKVSPLVDINEIISTVPGVFKTVTVSIAGECKETLVFVRSDVTVQVHDCTIQATAVSGDGEKKIHIQKYANNTVTRSISPVLKTYLYEPDAAFRHARCCEQLAQVHALEFINLYTDLMTSDIFVPDFPGRVTRICEHILWQRKRVSQFLSSRNIQNAIVCRVDFAMEVAQIRTLFHLKESKDHFLFFTSDQNRQPIVIYTQSISLKAENV